VVPAYTRNISAPLYSEDGLYINRAVHDCGIEGTANAECERYNEYSFNRSSILTCQDECETEDGCISCSYDYGPKGGSCRMHYQWIAGRVSVGNTGKSSSRMGVGRRGISVFPISLWVPEEVDRIMYEDLKNGAFAIIG
jgi:hypothetical protein